LLARRAATIVGVWRRCRAFYPFKCRDRSREYGSSRATRRR